MAGGQVTTTAGNRAQRGGGAPPRGQGPVQRFLNKASGKMETRQAMQHYRAPAGRPQSGRPQPGRPAGRPAPAPQQPSLIQMTPAQIEDRAKRIVNSEVDAERLPFQQRAGRFPQEEASQLSAHQQNYGQLDAGTAVLQAKQAESAKTYQNQAAEAVKKAEASNSVNEAALGGAPAPGSSLAKQQDAARTLLTAITASGQAGTNARQQAEADFLTNLRGTGAQQGAAGTRAIQGEYGRKKSENANEEARTLATKPGRVGKLVLGMAGEQEKLRIASAGLNIKGSEAERHNAETRSNINSKRQTGQLNARKLGLAERKQGADEAYKRATAPEKRLKDQLDTKKKEIEIKKALENHPGNGITADKVNELSGEAAKVFNLFRRARENGLPTATIRSALSQGYLRRSPSAAETKKLEKEGKKPWKAYNEKLGLSLKQPVWLDVAEQIMQKEYVDAPTKQRLRDMGLPDSEWSNHFLGGPSAARGVTGGAKAGKKKK